MISAVNVQSPECGRQASATRLGDSAAAHGRGARSASLDLKEEHLTFSECIPPYIPASRGLDAPLEGWEKPSIAGWVPDQEGNMVAKVQRFKAGGFEITCKKLNLPDLARMMDGRRKLGKREAPEESNPEMVRKASLRAKRKVRYSIKNIGADRLFTLTRRESDPSLFWDEAKWAWAWDRFVRLARKAGIELAYVAVLERHKKGNLHLHVAITGWINIKLARGIWWAVCGGRGEGNVDVQFKKFPGCSRLSASARIARYISKYVTKTFTETECHRFNKKRYWASRHDLPQARRIILNGMSMGEAFQELCGLFGLDPLVVSRDRHAFFLFFDHGGFWYSYDDHHGTPPPF